MNKRTYFTIGLKGEDDYELLYMGRDKEIARLTYLENRDNLDYDFVAMQVVQGFASRSRPNIQSEQAKEDAKRAVIKQEELIKHEAKLAEAKEKSLAVAALDAKEKKEKAEKQLQELKGKAAPAKKEPSKKEPSKKSASVKSE